MAHFLARGIIKATFPICQCQLPGCGLGDLLDKIDLVIEQGRLGYGGGDNGNL